MGLRLVPEGAEKILELTLHGLGALHQLEPLGAFFAEKVLATAASDLCLASLTRLRVADRQVEACITSETRKIVL